jgi:hypothetical protein
MLKCLWLDSRQSRSPGKSDSAAVDFRRRTRQLHSSDWAAAWISCCRGGGGGASLGRCQYVASVGIGREMGGSHRCYVKVRVLLTFAMSAMLSATPFAKGLLVVQLCAEPDKYRHLRAAARQQQGFAVSIFRVVVEAIFHRDGGGAYATGCAEMRVFLSCWSIFWLATVL